MLAALQLVSLCWQLIFVTVLLKLTAKHGNGQAFACIGSAMINITSVV
jgi:hypothetical protein